MSTTSLPPHLAAQSFASQPVQKRPLQDQPQSALTGGGGFEALALKSANPSRVITGKPVETAAAVAVPVSAPAAPTPAVQARPPVSALDELTPLSRPGSKLDIRV